MRPPALASLRRATVTGRAMTFWMLIMRRLTTQRGATAVEYGLLVALIAAAIVSAVLLFRGEVVGLFEHTNASIDNAVNP